MMKNNTMKEELLDIFDEQNNSTGEAKPRSVVHTEGLWHRTVHIYLFNDSDKSNPSFLVHLRSKTKDRNPNMWALPFGGHSKSGESIAQTVESELMEEIRLKIDMSELIDAGYFSYDGGENKEHIYLYYYRYQGDASELVFYDDEVQEVKWMKASKIESEILSQPEIWANSHKSFVHIMKELQKHI